MIWHHKLSLAIITMYIVAALLQSGCARSTVGARVEKEVSQPPVPLIEEPPETPPPAERQVYDLEEEMPEEDSVEPADLEESIEPLVSDSVKIEEMTPVAEPLDAFGIGYRIQVFASKELDSAERVKEKAAGATALPVYIEFEDGYYKVRAGDFLTREIAAAERAKLSELYPDCWIVSTTIRK
jgi:hypothetical protein